MKSHILPKYLLFVRIIEEQQVLSNAAFRFSVSVARDLVR